MYQPSRSGSPLLIRALQRGLKIPAKVREWLVLVLCENTSDPKARPQERAAAARALVGGPGAALRYAAATGRPLGPSKEPGPDPPHPMAPGPDPWPLASSPDGRPLADGGVLARVTIDAPVPPR